MGGASDAGLVTEFRRRDGVAVDAGEGGVVVVFCYRAQRAGVDGVGYLWRGEGGR